MGSERKPSSEDVYGSGRLIRGFASAGDGNRTGRKISTRGGLTTTSRETNRRKNRQRGAHDDKILVEIDPEEFWRFYNGGRCWFCGADANDGGKPFKALSQHFSRGHGIDLNDLRDHLLLPRNYSFISEETRKKYSDRGKRLYDPERLKQKPGTRHEIGLYGRISARFRTTKEAALPSSIRATQHGLVERFECSTCGRTFDARPSKRRRDGQTFCSPTCLVEGRRRRMLADNPTKRPDVALKISKAKKGKPNPAAREYARQGRLVVGEVAIKWKQCINCGAPFYGHSMTCSKKCEHENRSKVMQEAARRRLQGDSPRVSCSVDGCSNPHRARGLCAQHYQKWASSRQSVPSDV